MSKPTANSSYGKRGGGSPPGTPPTDPVEGTPAVVPPNAPRKRTGHSAGVGYLDDVKAAFKNAKRRLEYPDDELEVVSDAQPPTPTQEVEDEPAPQPQYVWDNDKEPVSQGEFRKHLDVFKAIEGIREKRIGQCYHKMSELVVKATEMRKDLEQIQRTLSDHGETLSKLNGMSSFSYAVSKRLVERGCVPDWKPKSSGY